MFKRKKNKIFCISFQRTGTTSVGHFFKDFGYKVAGYDRKRSNDWSVKRFIGDYDGIFRAKEFKQHQVFEDNPWFLDDFYKILYHKFPTAKFVLFTRDADKWFDSMVSHSKGKTLGNTFRHSKTYKREEEYYNKYPNLDFNARMKDIDNLLDLNETHRDHYKSIYNLRNKEVIEYFNEFNPSALFIGQLEDSNKWKKLGDYFKINVPCDYDVHVNKSITTND